MAAVPIDFIEHLRAEGYHPRSNKHSNVLAELMVRDLLSFCAPMREKARQGGLVYELNQTLITGTATWNVDLVLGDPPPGQSVDPEDRLIARSVPSTTQIAVEIKSVMTEHRKAIKNRKRDFEAHHDHVHRYHPRAIAGGLLVINGASTFKSPLRVDPEPTRHKEPESLVEHCVREFRAVSSRGGETGPGLEAKGILVVDFDNVDREAVRYIQRGAAPPVGDPLHYDHFLQSICRHYEVRFG